MEIEDPARGARRRRGRAVHRAGRRLRRLAAADALRTGARLPRPRAPPLEGHRSARAQSPLRVLHPRRLRLEVRRTERLGCGLRPGRALVVLPDDRLPLVARPRPSRARRRSARARLTAASLNLGALFFPSFARGYTLTGDPELGATAMTGRQDDGRCATTPWSGRCCRGRGEEFNVIIDSLMKSQLLWWAVEERRLAGARRHRPSARADHRARLRARRRQHLAHGLLRRGDGRGDAARPGERLLASTPPGRADRPGRSWGSRPRTARPRDERFLVAARQGDGLVPRPPARGQGAVLGLRRSGHPGRAEGLLRGRDRRLRPDRPGAGRAVRGAARGVSRRRARHPRQPDVAGVLSRSRANPAVLLHGTYLVAHRASSTAGSPTATRSSSRRCCGLRRADPEVRGARGASVRGRQGRPRPGRRRRPRPRVGGRAARSARPAPLRRRRRSARCGVALREATAAPPCCASRSPRTGGAGAASLRDDDQRRDGGLRDARLRAAPGALGARELRRHHARGGQPHRRGPRSAAALTRRPRRGPRLQWRRP